VLVTSFLFILPDDYDDDDDDDSLLSLLLLVNFCWLQILAIVDSSPPATVVYSLLL
jgi:hypothetical protein